MMTKNLDLTSCDVEPIHLPGSIQPHGAMLVVDSSTFAVMQAAGDTEALIGRKVRSLPGLDLGSLLTAAQVAYLRDLCARAAMIQPRHLLDPLLRVVADRPVDASVHRCDTMLVIEWEAADLGDPHAADPLSTVQSLLESISGTETTRAFCNAAAQAMRQVTGFDRVMVYQFLEDDSGWVIAESHANHLFPFLDLHYPASDVPAQARALYAKNWIRLIAQVDYQPAPVYPQINPQTGLPLDMSFATLRDVSPMHREYLRNMGVAASMSISIMRDAQLWGLIACHHYSPHRLPRHLRAVCELFGSMFSLQLEVRKHAENLQARLASRRILQALMQDFAQETEYGEGLLKQADRLLQYVNADGIGVRVSDLAGLAIRISGNVTCVGPTPPAELIRELTDWLGQREDVEEVFTTDRLGEMWPPARAYADVASGLLAISISREPRDFILWFRPEVVSTVTWAGDPHKPVEISPQGERLTPRKSFAAWKESVYGRSSPWTGPEAEAAFDLKIALVDVVLRRIDLVARTQARAREREQLLMAELDHRVKNSLAVVQALVRNSSRGAASLTDYITSLEQRIRSMARAHSLLTQGRWEGVSLRTVLQEEVDQYTQHAAVSVTLNGGDFILEPKSALALSLAVHELSTNAAKYGALSTVSGRVTITWERDSNDDLALCWTESGGPAVRPPEKGGFGSTLIERALAMETGGRSSLRFLTGGVQCDIVLPGASLIRVVSSSPVDVGSASASVAEAKATTPSVPRILVVEDTSLIVMLIEQLFSDLGWTMIGPATRLAEAVALAERETFDAAIVDINLAGEMSWDVADVLQRRNIPLMFSTGYDSATILPPSLSHMPIISKPFLLADLERRLRQLISSRPSSPLPNAISDLS